MIRKRLSAVLSIAVVVFVVGCGTTSPPPTPDVTAPAQVAVSTVVSSSGLPLTGDDAVEFLRTAQITGRLEKEFDSLAISDPVRVTLTDGQMTARAVFKDIDKYDLKFKYGDGRTLTRVKDTYRHEIAAYKLDAMLGLGIVPPCTERTIGSHTGSLCLWVEHAMTESERIKKQIQPPNAVEFNNQMLVIRLFHQLIWDADYNNVRNLLIDESFKLHKIDSSMAFRMDPTLRKEDSLNRFSKKFLTALKSLDRESLNEGLRPWLNDQQIETLWQRRERILQLADERVASYGETVALY